MAELAVRCMDAFGTWLTSLADDAVALSMLLENPSKLPASAQRHLIFGLNYICKSLDIIPDGVEDLGYLDDAFVLRMTVRHALDELVDPGAVEGSQVLVRLADDAHLIQESMPEHHARFVKFVRQMDRGTALGRTVDDVLTHDEARAGLIADIATWAKGYQAPTFSKDERVLIKLQAFFAARLP